jgi:RNA polymerase sigma factor (sigma-70 family)
MNAEARQPAAAEFFREEHGRLVGYVRRWLDDAAGEEAEDIVQDVALNVFDRGDITAPIRDLSAYVYRALKNRIVDYLRQRKSPVSLDAPRNGEDGTTLADVLSDRSPALQSGLERRQLHERLYRAIDALKPEDRALIMATDFEGWTFQELADQWDVPLGTLLDRKSRALKKIRKYLEASDKEL